MSVAVNLHVLTKQLEVSGTPVGSSESLCMKFNGVVGVEKRGREFVPVVIRFLGIRLLFGVFDKFLKFRKFQNFQNLLL